jgi:3'(2'), 5'-bisphosphate nucleotidase
MQLEELTAALSEKMPAVLRWCGAVAKRLRQFNISVTGKKVSGSANTDALTLADLSVQELLVAALRDLSPLFRQCRLEAEESTGDLAKFATHSPFTIAIDPIDGTKQYRDNTGSGWAVMLNMRTEGAVQYSLVYIPEKGPEGTWVEAVGNHRIAVGEDDPDRPAEDVVKSLPVITPESRKTGSKKIYMIGFQKEDPIKAKLVTDAGLEGHVSDDMPGSIFELFARGEYAGSLIHSPNVYDFPVTSHIARILGGDALWVHNQEPLHFRELWVDDRADMLRLPGIVACSHDREILRTLCDLAKDWNPKRYHD